MIIALAGRRIDAKGEKPPKFPLQNVMRVEERMRALLKEKEAIALLSSAACGADLVAQTVAGLLGIRRRVILPFDRERFRRTSVTDRPGNWGTIYDRLLKQLEEVNDIFTLPLNSEEARAYALVNLAILDQARALGLILQQDVLAALVWEGKSMGREDLTAAFGDEAGRRGVSVVEIRTI